MQIDLRVDHIDAECEQMIDKWTQWGRVHQVFSTGPGSMLALIPLPKPDYWAMIGTKSRNMVRKAVRRGLYYGEFDYNGFLSDIYEINTSMPERGGMPMARSYTEQPMPASGFPECSRHTVSWIGAFREGKLLAYCQLYTCGELAIINRILGHKDALGDGVMNGLVFHLVQFATARDCKALNYLTMESATEGLEAFKRHVGFRALPIELRT